VSAPAVAPLAALACLLLRLPRRVKRVMMMGADAIMLPAALWLALVLKFDRIVELREYGGACIFTAILCLAVFPALGLHRAIIHLMGLRTMGRVALGVTLCVLALGFFGRLVGGATISPSICAICWAVALLYVSGSRLLARRLLMYGNGKSTAKRVAIYGAGEAGASLCTALLAGCDFKPVIFIDDRKSLAGSQINGIPVFFVDGLPNLLRTHRVHRVLLAMPSASRRRRREILAALEPLGLCVQSLPDLSDIITGKARIDEWRDVDANDLLGRDPVPPDSQLLEPCIRGKCVMVTGAGGSIGSELCRQILRVSPRRLVLFEMCELALYTIERELQDIMTRDRLAVEIIPLLGNAHDARHIHEVLATYVVQTVYHAAAYKHLPIVEHNVIKGIHNNVISTWHAAEAALQTGVETFVLISTDKAVNPINVLGASKRLAELVLQALQGRTQRTRFCIVRFGNVLGSSGSVVPLFREQIRGGRPVTVTHPEMIRYFMTIPEATQLVIQAGSMASGGDVFVLDMGRPMRIDDLARRMISLMGLTVRDAADPHGDIDITYIGARNAEKLAEELLIGNNITKTDHPMIMRALEHSLPWSRMREILDELLIAFANCDCRHALAVLREAVAEYRPAGDIRDHMWTHKAVPSLSSDLILADLSPRRRYSDGSVTPLLSAGRSGPAPTVESADR
jgi:FlaA1/EpsC-like NDP-sugar epimerase